MTKPQINVTPLIDVLLVLLIIFMVVTPMKPSSFEAKIPAEPDNDPRVYVRPDTLIVSIGTDSKLRLNRDDLAASVAEPAVLIEGLRAVFEQRMQNGAFVENADGGSEQHIEKTVFIKAPRGLDYGSVAKVVDAVKTAGANPVSLQIDGLD
jgi:biopolymer transport protein ExbD